MESLISDNPETTQMIVNEIDFVEYTRKSLNSISLIKFKAGIKGLKVGEQHPYYQQLMDDGTIPKLIQIFKGEKDEDIHDYIAQTLAYLFKALLLPTEIKNDVIEQLKKEEYFDGLAILTENQDNHDAILANGYEKKL
ncbi:MAG: hypothetical protein EZS28_019843 [Streblomastix strix]|uniref:Uncharacterized protein n=1 Tax=Streblomastix strix TaxID=222440 RepID=A0A5J4VPV8_9EUKA|nr:MAG: hypothetical protein EZS28_019843 [Streblomastix strix]